MADLSSCNVILLKIANVLTYTAYMILDIFKIHHFVFRGKETYVSPARWASILLYAIHVLFIWTLVYQFFPKGKQIIIGEISWRLPLLFTINILYIVFWGIRFYIFAFILAVLSGLLTTRIYYTTIRKHHREHNFAEQIAIHIPFSLFHAWNVLTIVTTACEIIGLQWYGGYTNLATKVLVFIALAILQVAAAAYSFSGGGADLPASIAMAWFLSAIYDHQSVHNAGHFIHWSALSFSLISVALAVKCSWTVYARVTGASDLRSHFASAIETLRGEPEGPVRLEDDVERGILLPTNKSAPSRPSCST